MSDTATTPAGLRGLSPPGLLFSVLGAVSLLLPFMTLRANRIVAGEGLPAWQIAEPGITLPGLTVLALGLALGLPASRPALRLGGALLALAALILLLTNGATALMQDAGDYARVSPASGFWCLLAVTLLLAADALAQMRPGPALRAVLLAGALGALWATLTSGLLSELSIGIEYASRAAGFAQATVRHLWLSLGSLAVAAAIGFPLGIACHRVPAMRAATLATLSFVQTIPSLAMFGIMIPLLGALVTALPALQAMGIAGIGFAPAFLALVLYSLLPVVANTVAGLDAAPKPAIEAARGMGLTPMQRLWQVELPLGLPVLLAGVRIVLVQNIGLAVIAGLIGGGGYGTFVFQGLNQTATDLILLGALPTVLLAMVAAITMDILVDLARRTPEHAR